MRKYAPSKKFILLVLGLLIIGGSFLIFEKFFNEKRTHNPITNAKNQLKAGPVIAEEIAKDSDADGLKDWEEELWKTDKNNPDTDKDGTPDGQEIKENRNPLAAGPNDKLASSEFFSAPSGQETNSSPVNATENIGRQLLSSYILAKQQNSGSGLGENDKDQILKYIMESIEGISPSNGTTQKIYTEKEIKITFDESRKSIKSYGNNLAIIIKKYFDYLPETEMTIFNRAVSLAEQSAETGGENAPESAVKEIEKLKPLADAYKNSAKETILLSVPESFSQNHLALINSFYGISRQIEMMQGVFSDPAAAISAISHYKKDAAKAYETLYGINDYFAENGVVFADSEPGEFFAIYPKIKKAAELAAKEIASLQKQQ